MAYHRYHGVNTHIIRIFNTYGPFMRLDDGRVVPNLMGQALRGEPLTVFGTGSQTRSFCYVSDLVDGLCRLMLSEERYPVNLGNPCEMTVLQFAEQIRVLTGSSAPIHFEPLPEDDPKQRKPDISKATRILGWQPNVALDSRGSSRALRGREARAFPRYDAIRLRSRAVDDGPVLLPPRPKGLHRSRLL